MRKNKKIGLIIFFLAFAIFGSSCVKRRIQALDKKRIESRAAGHDLSPKVESFYPDKIKDFSIDQYLKWYKDLNAPPHLQLPVYESPKKLTKTEMVADFEYLFAELKESYPFFEVLKREENIDFIKNHDQYLKKIRKCENDEEFIKALKDIMADLHNYHAKIADRTYVDTTMRYYSQNWNQPSIYYEFINLNRQAVRNRYGLDGLQAQSSSGLIKRKKTSAVAKEKSTNLTFESQGDLAILKIGQMIDLTDISQDEKVLDEFLKNKHMYRGLVIDIRDNVGGNMEYWQNFLLPKLITDQKQVTNHMFFKNSPKSKLILSDNTLNVETLSNVDITGIKLDYSEDLKDFHYYIKDLIVINPDESKKDNGYRGQIFLLVNENVFSAAEGLASFIKHTDLATIVGSQTGGDGITLGVINSVLPNSGLVFTYTNTLGYAADGTINEEDPTMPDIKTSSYRQSIDTIEKQLK